MVVVVVVVVAKSVHPRAHFGVIVNHNKKILMGSYFG